MERVKHTIKIYDNFLEITPDEGIKNDSIYEIRVKGLESQTGLKKLDGLLKLKICTKLTPAYCSLEAVRSLTDSYEVSEERTLYFIREASRFAEYVTKKEYKEPNIPFEVTQYTKYKAAHDSLLKFYMDKASGSGIKGKLGEISFENSSQYPAFKDLLETLAREVRRWEEHLRGNGFEGRAKPASAVKSSRYSPSPYVSKTGASSYGTFVTGFSRGVSRK